jgi:hypothetical protein
MRTVLSWSDWRGRVLVTGCLLLGLAACGGKGGAEVEGGRCEVCPAGASYDSQAQACVCQGADGCPGGLDLIEGRCVDGSQCDGQAHRCACVQDLACGEGYICAKGTGECMCASDACCSAARVGYTYDPESYMCVCVSDECCKELGLGAHYDPTRKMCVCSDDASCPTDFKCDAGTAQCLCQNDAACVTLYGEGQFCNDFGFCQKTAGCFSTFDCRANLICDVATHECIEASSCTASAQCPLGQICRAGEGRCSPGCDVTGDCQLGEVCVNGACTAGVCEDSSYCPVGSFCNPTTKVCYPATRNYCKACSAGIDCDVNNGELCLRLAVEGGGSFCAVECAKQSDCPSGYGCWGSYTVCLLGSCPSGWKCQDVNILGQPDPVKLCVDATTSEIKPTSYHCSPSASECP